MKLGESSADQLTALGHMFVPWGGVYMRDQGKAIKKNDIYPRFFIFNLQASTEGTGTHWVVLIFVSKTETYYFDPFGQPQPSAILEVIHRQYHHVRQQQHLHYLRNKDDIQAFNSDNCGYFCMYILYQFMIGRPPHSVVALDFTDHLKRNDLVLQRYWNRKSIGLFLQQHPQAKTIPFPYTSGRSTLGPNKRTRSTKGEDQSSEPSIPSPSLDVVS